MIPQFKYHNIYLRQGTWTIPGQNPFGLDQRVQMIFRNIAGAYPQHIRRRIHIADLGPLEGGHAVELSRMGFSVTLIEAREENVNKLNWLKHTQYLENFRVVHDDVKNLRNYGPFDVVLCAGLLYHLDTPVACISDMSSVCKDKLIISTHYSQRKDAMYDNFPFLNKIKRAIGKRFPSVFAKHHYGLSDLQCNEGRPGRWLTEYNSEGIKDKLLASAWSNSRSFWLTKEALINAIEEEDFKVKLANEYPLHDSGLFICDRIK